MGVIGREMDFCIWAIKSLTFWAEGPYVPSIFRGIPITRPVIWWVSINAVMAEMTCEGELLSKKGRGVARIPIGSDRARPMRTVP
jgi:hypothetical protein